MTSRSAENGSMALSIVATFFAIAAGAFIGVVAGRDPLILYVITTPFALFVLFLARGVGEEPEPPPQRAPSEARTAVVSPQNVQTAAR